MPLFLEYHYQTYWFQGGNPVAVLELVDCQGHLSDGEENDGSFICTIFLEKIKKIDPHKSITDVVMFDGASNVQLAGELVKNSLSKGFSYTWG